ncbi:hypothetical protein ACMXYX_17970 (plasmid) [Neptuniibacter sp. QD72_48]|uniref:hypothetical protein n=1 Tax=Neptuniibacter sp. QD72_48 TaxID=3398214 RepID=UPI0039F57164
MKHKSQDEIDKHREYVERRLEQRFMLALGDEHALEEPYWDIERNHQQQDREPSSK